MAIELPNGAVVSSFYSDGSGELLAVFQYIRDAKDWAAVKVVEDAKAGCARDLLVTSLYDGKSTMHRAPTAQGEG